MASMLRKERERLGLRARDLAEVVGVSVGAIYHLETGRIRCSAEREQRLIDILRVIAKHREQQRDVLRHAGLVSVSEACQDIVSDLRFRPRRDELAALAAK